MTDKKKEDVIQFFSAKAEFAAEEEKLKELKQSSLVEDQITAILMEPHTGKPFTDEADACGLWYAFARPKALAILKRFNVTARDNGSPLSA